MADQYDTLGTLEEDEPGFSRRRFLRQSLAFGALAAAGPSVLAACSSSSSSSTSTAGGATLDKLRKQGYATVGFANENPYGYENSSGQLTGEAPEVARAVLKKMGVNNIRGTLVDFGALIPGLQAGRYNLIAAGMFITPARCAAITFSDPDYCAQEALGVLAGNPKHLSDYKSVAANPGVRLAVVTGAVELGYAKAAGVPDSQLVVLGTSQEVLQAVQAGRADAFSLTDITVRQLVSTTGGKQVALPPFTPVVNGKPQFGCGGYGFVTSDQQFRNAFNSQLDAMKKSGEILPIVQKFGFTKQNTDLAQQYTAASLCKG